MTKAPIVWNGFEALRPFLVAVDKLQRHPKNPRRGAVAEIKASLERFGQVRPLLADKGVIVAGNHTFLAALELGWTHVAAVANDFKSEEEARAYLLADNHLPELGGYDEAQLSALLAELEAHAAWSGTGYGPPDLRRLVASLDSLANTAPPSPPAPAPSGSRVETREVVLLYSAADYEELGRHLQILQKEWGTDDAVELIYRAVAEEAARLNQGAAA